MALSQFSFLRAEWPELFEPAARAESLAMGDARAACFYARRTLELAVAWLYKNDSSLRLPYQDHLSALLHEPTFRAALGPAVWAKTRVIRELGNQAVHSHAPVRQFDAVAALRELFHFTFWVARTYSRGVKAPPGLAFDPSALAITTPLPKQTMEQLQRMEAQLRERDEKLSSLLADKTALDAELVRLRAEVAAVKQANTAQADTHDYSEAKTRDYFIDLLLKESGRALDQGRDREYEVSGMPNEQGRGFVDYALWGDDGLPLAIVEAKRTRKSAQIGQQQAKLYADCLEKEFGRRPVIYYSNGYEHWLWDDVNYPPRAVQGFHKKAELELMIQRRETMKKLADAGISVEIVERGYQHRAIRRIGEAFEIDHDRKALIVMATGAGKTRVVIALCDLLMRCNCVKRVLFLADRKALVKQAVNAFKKHLPDSSPVNLVTDKYKEGRVHVSTYATMMGLIDEAKDGQKRFGIGHYDLVIIDEAHRSVYQKYRAIFVYYDSLLVGLTATPKDEIDFNTYGLFDLERGVPTDAYPPEEAVRDVHLVPPKAMSVPLKFQREGIKYDQLSEEEKEEWDAKEWSEDGEVADRVEAEAVNKWLFNKNTVDKVLGHLMTRGQKVAGGDRLGKTIIFAKNQAHAEFIAERFDANYPHLKGKFARVIHCGLPYAQNSIDNFSQKDKQPHIAISVDMLDTGIDVPEVVNLVFFKLVRSKTKFWQMLGRGTRLCPDLFAPGKDKEFFYVFDYCQNPEFFSQNPETTDGSLGASLGKRLFTSRLELMAALDKQLGAELVLREGPHSFGGLRGELATLLREEVAGMNLDNFIVRPQRRWVEKYAVADAWTTLTNEALGELADSVAGLPSQIETDEEKASIPMVQQQMALIQQIQTDEWWQDVAAPMLDQARKRLRLLVKLIEKQGRKPIYTNFEDHMGEETSFDLPGFSAGDSYERFRAKARHFLKAHEDHLTIHKLRLNEPLTATDLAELERMLIESGIGTTGNLEKAKACSNGLGLFVRSLVGMDRQAAKNALGVFLAGANLRANQIQFLDEVVDHLTEHGCMDAARLYETPYTNFHSQGVEGVFDSRQVDALISILEDVRSRASA